MKMKTITNDKYYVTFKHFCQALDLPKNASGGELIVCQISFLLSPTMFALLPNKIQDVLVDHLLHRRC